jgi:DNA-binding response OmpR family regulator
MMLSTSVPYKSKTANTILYILLAFYDLIVLLASHPGRAFSREYLLQMLWSYDYDGFDRPVDIHVTRLRKKPEPPGEKITTVWGVGYRFTI